MDMKWYPWLNFNYKNIITSYTNNKLHHAIIIQSYYIQDTSYLIWAIIRWMFCSNKKGIKSCGICKDCILLLTKNHPDFYCLHPKKNKKFLEVEIIRQTINILLHTSQQYGNKVVWIPNYNSLTQFGINALLKIVEEPPQNTFFFIGNNIIQTINLTLRSRFLLYRIFTLKEKIGLQWMQKKTKINKKICLISLRMNYNHPKLAQKLLTQNIWLERKILYNQLIDAIQKNNFIKLLPILNNHTIIKIQWIILLLLDVMKIKNNFIVLLINLDYQSLINIMKKKYSYNQLDKIIKSWIACRYKLINIENINYELLIIQQLMKWEHVFYVA